MTSRSLLTSLLALSLSLALLPGCGRDKGSATPQAAQELAELRAEQELGFAHDADSELQAEIAALLSRFERSADATLASSPHRITLLHLACVYKKPELARCLLLDGADPNARQLTDAPTAAMDAEDTPSLRPGDTPLSWAVIPHREGATAAEMLPLIDILVQNGANVNQPGPFDAPPLVSAALVASPAGEEVFLHLLKLGGRASEFTLPDGSGKTVPLSALVAANGWVQALEKLLDNGAAVATPALSALHAAADQPEQEGSLDCAKLILARGAEVDALNHEGATALYIAAHGLASPQGKRPDVVESTAAMLELLLKHGADPLLCCDADPEFPGSCAADFIAMNPEVQQKLSEMGIEVPRRRIDFSSAGAALLADICRASLFETPAEELHSHFAKLAAVLVTPAAEMQQSHLYTDAAGHTVKLLARADATQAAELVTRLPLWRDDEAWKSGSPLTASLMQAILDSPELAMPREALITHARHMDSIGVSEVAAVLVELLERDADACTEIEALCTDPSPAIRAGALTARLLRAGLPAPRNGAVAEWMEEHGMADTSGSPALARALLLTSLDKFWYGEMPAEELRNLLEAMRDIGAPKAAAFYATLALRLNNPEELERLTTPGGEGEAARYELECATALFIWSQREELLRLIEGRN